MADGIVIPHVGMKGFKTSEYYRNLVQIYLDRHDYSSAQYWADKLVSISNGCQQDVYNLAKCMYHSGQYLRAVALLKNHHYDRTNLYFKVLVARCYYMAKNYVKALDALDLKDRNALKNEIRRSSWEPCDATKIGKDTLINGQLFLMKGKVYDALMNRSLAAINYKRALVQDIYCYEAFELLTQHQMLCRSEEVNLIQSLKFHDCCMNQDEDLVKYLYSARIKKYPSTQEASVGAVCMPMRNNLDILTGDAERYFYNCDFQMAYSICVFVIDEDPFHMTCLPVYLACLVELKKNTELYKIAHKLIDVMPNSPLSWYSVGAYYYSSGKNDLCRRYLNKTLSIDPIFGPAWLLFGHSFAAESEHDQAMASYFKATQLMKGCHLPMLHVGLECGLSNNPQLAMKFLEEARLLATNDPFIRHEMGVVKYQEKRYDLARDYFLETLSILNQNSQNTNIRKWEPLFNNLGHVSRKLGCLEEAYRYHQRALVLCPSNASTHAAIGFVHAITGKTDEAIECFHKALSFKRDDPFSNTMLRYVIEKAVEEESLEGSSVYGKDDMSVIEELTEEEILLLSSNTLDFPFARNTSSQYILKVDDRSPYTADLGVDGEVNGIRNRGWSEPSKANSQLTWFTQTLERFNMGGKTVTGGAANVLLGKTPPLGQLGPPSLPIPKY